MEIAPGTEIGPYVIDREVGRGGMGVVYAATDSRLGRSVAIKALPAEFAADADRLARFEREARTLASLNHPNVAQIYGVEGGVEEKDDARYIVMEMVEGQTLTERLDAGALTADDAVELMIQVARGLGAAHDAGIVHRDLKPANIKLAGDGTAKVLDFGLARPDEAMTSTGSSVSQLPTLTTPAASPTMAGAIMGTAPYMSPEQARGRRTDKRTDIWSFGVVLYECLTGAGPFIGETMTDSLGAILHKDVDLDSLPPGTPASVRRVLQRCLERDRNRRYHDINDARIELETGGVEAVAQSSGPGGARVALVGAAMLALGAGLAWGVAQLGAAAAPAPETARFTVDLAPGLRIGRSAGAPFDISPDGSRVVVCASAEGEPPSLWLRDIGADLPTEVLGTAGAEQPSFSPNGEWIAYYASNALYKVAVGGGSPIRLCAAQGNHRAIAWAGMNRLIFAPNTSTALLQVDAAGGTPQEITSLTDETSGTTYRSHRWPHTTSDGSQLLYVAQESGDDFSNSEIRVLDLQTGQDTLLHKGGAFPQTLGDDTLLFVRDTIVFAAPIDWTGPRLSATPRPVQSGVQSQRLNGGAIFAVSDAGTVLYGEGGIDANLESMPTWVDVETGELTPFLDQPAPLDVPRISPDGKSVAFQTISVNDTEILIYEVARKVVTRLLTPERALFPAWTPDSRSVVFSAPVEGRATVPHLHRIGVDGESAAELIAPIGTAPQFTSDVSPDGRYAAYMTTSDVTDWDIHLLRLDGEEPLVQTAITSPRGEFDAVFSPDSAWMAYGSSVTGESEIYIRRVEGAPMRMQISVGGGEEPHWTADGLGLLYLADEEGGGMRKLMRVDLTPDGEAFEPSLPVLAVEFPVSQYGSPYPRFDYDPATNRLLTLAPIDNGPEQVERLYHAIVDWTTHVNRVLDSD